MFKSQIKRVVIKNNDLIHEYKIPYKKVFSDPTIKYDVENNEISLSFKLVNEKNYESTQMIFNTNEVDITIDNHPKPNVRIIVKNIKDVKIVYKVNKSKDIVNLGTIFQYCTNNTIIITSSTIINRFKVMKYVGIDDDCVNGWLLYDLLERVYIMLQCKSKYPFMFYKKYMYVAKFLTLNKTNIL